MSDNLYGIEYGPSGVPFIRTRNEREAAIMDTMGERAGTEFIISMRAGQNDRRPVSQIIDAARPSRPSTRERILDALRLRFPPKTNQL